MDHKTEQSASPKLNKEIIILNADDDDGHADLIRKNLFRSGIVNPILHFKNGQEVVNYLFRLGAGPHRNIGDSYVLLLDIRMPQLDGIEVLKLIKSDPELHKLPVVMISTTDDPREVKRCHELGCNNYITKPVEYDDFVDTIRKLGLFLSIVKVPEINGRH